MFINIHKRFLAISFFKVFYTVIIIIIVNINLDFYVHFPHHFRFTYSVIIALNIIKNINIYIYVCEIFIFFDSYFIYAFLSNIKIKYLYQRTKY